jgi:histone H3/H4
MQALRSTLLARETYITMLLIFKNILPRDMINHIYSYVHIKEKPTIKYQNFNKGIKEISKDMKHKFSKGGYHIINCMISVFVVKMVNMGSLLAQHKRSYTITSREIQTGIRVLPHNDDGKLLKLMVSNATKAITRYNADYTEIDTDRKQRRNVRTDTRLYLYPSRIETIMRQHISNHKDDEFEYTRLGVGATIYLTGALDIIVKEIIMSSEKYKTTRKIISMDSILNGCKNNETLKLLFAELFI